MNIDWKRKLSSRKLWFAVAGFVSGLMVFCGRSESEATQVSVYFVMRKSNFLASRNPIYCHQKIQLSVI